MTKREELKEMKRCVVCGEPNGFIQDIPWRCWECMRRDGDTAYKNFFPIPYEDLGFD